MSKEIKSCRICGNSNLVPVLNLGEQALTGVFPARKDERITSGPLELVKCDGQSKNNCGLLQLHHSYDHNEMYGMNYGYRSGLNKSMVSHLQDVAGYIQDFVEIRKDDIILDIGSNDGTLLKSYGTHNCRFIGIDPTAHKFRSYYPDNIEVATEFFSSAVFKRIAGGGRARIITSIAMFYDLESPMEFVSNISEILADDGVWFFEQSYMPSMLATTSYDTVCHEHLEYYALRQIKWMLDKAGLKILDVRFNDINGGSFAVLAGKNSSHVKCGTGVDSLLKKEDIEGFDTLKPYELFKKSTISHRDELKKTLSSIKACGGRLYGYGASTKGNVLLQYCGLTSADLPYIGEVNPNKFGCYTPGTLIPIISEEDLKAMNPTHLLVLPWHFRKSFIDREKSFLAAGNHLVFPLPRVEIFRS